MTKNTYKAMQVTRPGLLELVERQIPEPGTGDVLIEVQACGVCGADAGAIEGLEGGLQLPRVPGHEVVGRIVALGAGVQGGWRVGQRVGIGRLGGHCNACEQCRRGHFNLCSNQPMVGSSRDGGYAEMMTARATGLVAIPDQLDAVEAAPLLCAGIATFNALRKSGAQAGDLVAIQGIGGLGHLAIQYARRMGFKVVAVGRGADIAQDVLALGAHHYLDTHVEDPVARLKEMGGAQVILTTITDSAAVSSLMPALAPQGRLLVVGVGQQPLTIMPGALVGGERSVQGAITGTPYESEKTLDFSVMTDVRAMIETRPLENAWEAYQKVKSGEVKFRMVLTMDSGVV
ncbi:alcohol dehydrogenase catalytic domain-containing protein [Pseudomonas corrugata]|uniref:Alcohol dehydrogenase catalytic domain-containing protein n=1 Tax=Pseudomonas corrugata TaxID=47879 RepID=A0A7Y5Z0P9_9PSED|nr:MULTISPECIES: alcohol dehydrogenase [Pseudomonas]MCI0994958.1 alcohol dehydrogenase catalytic domain-containing protein [Pseudomonas corrugata]NUT65712.1 alcohol dehydrogenase catalytic domain-containing protein [Pseudomonas corrugata]NUT84885.1 alcohol dehydrogenase catalytic domain-containing protein [Pseudomonas corrugata]TNF84435.1 zinc-binding dehydrogenase [Pseudomonas sp. ICMP22404]